MRPVVVLSLLLAALAPASAQIGYPMRSGPTQPSVLVDQMVRYAAGQPIPAVVVELFRFPVPPRNAQDVVGVPVPDAMASLARVYSTTSPSQPPGPLEALQIGPAWTIAPTQRLETVTDLSGLKPLDVLTPVRTLEMLARSLTRAQLDRATTKGLRRTEMNALQKSLWDNLFRSQADVTREVKMPDGGQSSESVTIPVGAWARDKVALYIHAVFSQFRYPYEDASGSRQTMHTGFPNVLPLRLALTGANGYSYDRLLLPAPVSVAIEKPEASTMPSGTVLEAPAGIQGKTTLGEAIAAIAKSRAVSLTVDRRYADRPAFVGDANLPAATVLEALARSAGMAWRPLGDGAWHLAPAGPPAAATALRLKEAAEPLLKADAELEKTTGQWRWDDVIEVIRPEPESRLGPTTAQIREYTRQDEMARNERYLPYAQMTPEQKVAIVKGMPRLFDNAARKELPPKEEWLQKGEVTSMGLMASLEIPGVGRAMMQMAMADLDRARWERNNPAMAEVAQPATGDLPTVTLSEETRGLAPPPLSAGDWPRLLAEMKERGLNTLYLPVLWNGHTLFPSAHFPLLPGQGSPDPLADIIRQAGEKDIKVIAVLHTLAWRFPDAAPDHWLSAHEDWVDRDALGRTRREWAKGRKYRPDDGPAFPYTIHDALGWSDFVNPRVPEVRAKLLGLAEELKRYPTLSGVALAHWSRGAGRSQNPPSSAPDLGFHVSERATFVRLSGMDPLDIGIGTNGRFDFQGDLRMMAVPDAWDRRRALSDRLLLAELQAALADAWDGGVQVFLGPVQGSRYSSAELADIFIAGGLGYIGGSGVYRHTPAEGPETGLTSRERLNRMFARNYIGRGPAGPMSGIVLDFTTAPDLLWDGLKLVQPAKQPDGVNPYVLFAPGRTH